MPLIGAIYTYTYEYIHRPCIAAFALCSSLNYAAEIKRPTYIRTYYLIHITYYDCFILMIYIYIYIYIFLYILILYLNDDSIK